MSLDEFQNPCPVESNTTERGVKRPVSPPSPTPEGLDTHSLYDRKQHGAKKGLDLPANLTTVPHFTTSENQFESSRPSEPKSAFQDAAAGVSDPALTRNDKANRSNLGLTGQPRIIRTPSRARSSTHHPSRSVSGTSSDIINQHPHSNLNQMGRPNSGFLPLSSTLPSEVTQSVNHPSETHPSNVVREGTVNLGLNQNPGRFVDTRGFGELLNPTGQLLVGTHPINQPPSLNQSSYGIFGLNSPPHLGSMISQPSNGLVGRPLDERSRPLENDGRDSRGGLMGGSNTPGLNELFSSYFGGALASESASRSSHHLEPQSRLGADEQNPFKPMSFNNPASHCELEQQGSLFAFAGGLSASKDDKNIGPEDGRQTERGESHSGGSIKEEGIYHAGFGPGAFFS